MTKTPLVSVIIPVYNGERYISSCLDDLMNQSYKNLEIIVINDGSTDNSEQIIKNYPVQLNSLPINSGISIARNRGIDTAKGEFIHFMDVDDSINNDYYKEMVDAITETDAEIACSGMLNEPKPHRTILFKERDIFITTEEKLKVTNVGKWGFSVRYLFKTDFLKKYNLRFIEGRLIEDLPFSLSAVFFANKLVTVPNAVYTYILRQNSVTTKRNYSFRSKRHRDLRFAKEFRHKFAREHNFKIPYVPTGRFSLFFVKWFT
jgi:glycosyltransferase involved in cell wall biosynthesis